MPILIDVQNNLIVAALDHGHIHELSSLDILFERINKYREEDIRRHKIGQVLKEIRCELKL